MKLSLRKVSKSLVSIFGLLIVVFIGFSFYVSRPAVDTSWSSSYEHQIANDDIALTFARSGRDIIKVESLDENYIAGFIINSDNYQNLDLLELYEQLGYEGLASLTGPKVQRAIENLSTPIDFTFPYIAAGTNYHEHAEEVLLKDKPFIFPKLAKATTWNSGVKEHSRLDFEAELAVVPLQKVLSKSDRVDFGLILANDFTDRWSLIRELDFDQPMGTTGFATAKGKPSFLPTGYLFVIPKSEEFYKTISIELAVNGKARQRFVAGDMILKVDEIVAESFEQSVQPYFKSMETIELLPKGHIPRGTLILTGTSVGVAFKPVNVWNPWFYLTEGDRVITRATYLGQLDNTIVGEK